MRRWLIAAGAVFVGLGAVFAIAVANLGRFVDANRARIDAALRDAVGRPVTFGTVHLALRNGPGVRVRDVRIGDDPRFGGEFLHVGEVDVSVRLLPALVGRYEIRRIALRAPVATIIRDAAGWNIDTLGAPPRPPPARAAGGGPPGGRAAALVLIAALDVRDGTVRYVDRRPTPPRELVADQLRVRIADPGLTRPIGVDVRAALAGAEAPNVRLAGTVGPIGDPPDPARAPVDLTLDVALDTGTAALLAALLDAPLPRDLVGAGPVAIHARAGGAVPALTLDATIDAGHAELRWGRWFVKPGDVPFALAIAGTRSADAVGLRTARVRLGDAQLAAIGTLWPGAPWTVDLALDAAGVPLASLARAMPALAGDQVGGTGDVHLTVQGPVGARHVPDLRGSLAVTDVQVRGGGWGDVDGLSATVAVQDGVARLPPTRFRLGDGTAEVAGAYTLADRVVAIDRVALQAFEGAMEGTGRIDLQDRRRPAIALRGTATGVSVGALLRARGVPWADRVDGRADAIFSVAGTRRRRQPLRRALAGEARVDVRDGVLRGVNVAETVLESITGIRGLSGLVPAPLRRRRPDLFEAADTRFETLGATLRLGEGRIGTDDLLMRSAAFTLTARGHATLAGTVDLAARWEAGPALTADVLATVKQARWVTNDAGRLEVPVHVAGRPPDLRVTPDAAFVARAVGRALAGEPESDRAPGVVGEALRKLQELFRR